MTPHVLEPDPDNPGWCACGLPAKNGVHLPTPEPERAVVMELPPTGMHHPFTSHESAALTGVEGFRRNKDKALAVIARRPSTTDEVQQTLGSIHQTVSSSINGLWHRDGYVMALLDDDGNEVTRPTRSGRQAIVWTVTTAGRAYLASLLRIAS